MIVYLDSSVLARAYLADEAGHDEVQSLLSDPAIAKVTGTWTKIEVSGALVRAARGKRIKEDELMAVLDADVSLDGPVTVLGAPQAEVEAQALPLVRQHSLRAMDAWHLAVALLTLPGLRDPGEAMAFASRDAAQSTVARLLGFEAWPEG